MTSLLWTQRQDIGPSARFGHALAYDEKRERTVLVGGDGLASLLRETWEWDGATWTQVDDLGPSGRAGHAVAYDAARTRLVLFGGRATGGVVGDTWERDDAGWTQVEDSGPRPRQRHGLAFDRARSRIVLFGGDDATGAPLADTWEWDGAHGLRSRTPGPAREPVTRSCSTRRPPGRSCSAALAAPETWAWDGTAWRQIADTGPAPSTDTALASGSAPASAFLFGGLDLRATPPAPTGLTWELDGAVWTERQDMGPSARAGHAMAYDGARGRIVLFGGSVVAPSAATAADLRDDTWELPVGASVPPLVGFTVNPPSAPAGQDVTLTVTLGGPAPVATAVMIQMARPGRQTADEGVIEVAAGQTTAQIITRSDQYAPGETTLGVMLGKVVLTATFTRL